MANSVTRAHTRRTAALTDALGAATDRWAAMGTQHPLAPLLEAELADRGLCIADIGGQQVDDDTVKRTDRP